MTDKVW